MSIIREKVKFNGENMGFKFTLGSNDSFTGFQREIDSLTQYNTNKAVNPVVDVEERKFKLNPDTPNQIFQFYFYNKTFGTWAISFANAGFTTISSLQSMALRKSFFILDFYDTYDVNTQTKIFTTYLTKLGLTPNYSVSSSTSNQLYYWYVPMSYLSSQSSTTVTGYVKFSFFNGKTGDVHLFYNQNNEALSTPEKMFFGATMDLVNKTWKIVTSDYPYVKAKEFGNNARYIDRINDTYNRFSGITQTYPTGNTYNYKSNTYFTK